MTDNAFNWKLYFMDVKSYERRADKYKQDVKTFDLSIGPLVSSNDFEPRATGYKINSYENKLYKYHQLIDKYNKAANQWAAELWKRYEIINRVPDPMKRTLLIRRYLLCQSVKDICKREEISRAAFHQYINAAFEDIARREPVTANNLV